MIDNIDTGVDEILRLRFSGIVREADYEALGASILPPLVPGTTRRLLAEFEDFHGWDTYAAWQDFKFTVEHYADFDRLAVVGGDQRCREWLARSNWPFTAAQVRYFGKDELYAALDWLRDGMILHRRPGTAGEGAVTDLLAEDVLPM